MTEYSALDPDDDRRMAEYVPLSPDQIAMCPEPEMLSIVDGEGNLLFGMKNDGSVILPDPDRIPEAAAIFWTEVARLADELGIIVVNPPMRGERNA